MLNPDSTSDWRCTFAGATLVFSFFVIGYFAISALGAKFGWWDWGFALGKLTREWGTRLVFGSLGLSVLALVLSLIKAPRKQAFILSVAALVVSGLIFGRMLGVRGNVERLPPLHDIQTDWSNPIMPSDTLLAIRKADGAMNSIEAAPVLPEAVNGTWPGLGGRLVSEVQEEAEFKPWDDKKSPKATPYPKIAPLVVTWLTPQQVYEGTLASVGGQGWELVTDDPEAGVIEATAETMWFGFKDDVLVRVQAREDGATVIDVRSISRVGLSDIGANAKRVRNLLDEVEVRLRKMGGTVASPDN